MIGKNKKQTVEKKDRKKLSLFSKILIGFAVGVVLGIVFGDKIMVIKPVGDLFMKLLKMLIMPLVFSAIISGITNIPDMKQLLNMGVKAFVLFVITTAVAIATGMIFGNIFKPGIGGGLSIPQAQVEDTSFSLVDTVLNIVPENVFESLTSNNLMLQVICFAIFFGICILLCGEPAKIVADFFDKVAQVMYKMTDLIIGLAPIGVCALIATIIGQYGLTALLPLMKFLIVFHVAIIFFVIVFQGGFVAIGCKMNPFKFFKQLFGSISMAYVTDSSAAALPVAIKELQLNIGVPESITNFIMPIGTNMNKNGSALYQGIVAIFIAQIMGVDLSITQQVLVLFTALLGAIGTAGIPSASLVMLSMTLSCVGLPLEGIALMAGIDRILGGARTFPNVTGNAAITTLIARQEGVLQSKEGTKKDN